MTFQTITLFSFQLIVCQIIWSIILTIISFTIGILINIYLSEFLQRNKYLQQLSYYKASLLSATRFFLCLFIYFFLIIDSSYINLSILFFFLQGILTATCHISNIISGFCKQQRETMLIMNFSKKIVQKNIILIYRVKILYIIFTEWCFFFYQSCFFLLLRKKNHSQIKQIGSFVAFFPIYIIMCILFFILVIFFYKKLKRIRFFSKYMI